MEQNNINKLEVQKKFTEILLDWINSKRNKKIKFNINESEENFIYFVCNSRYCKFIEKIVVDNGLYWSNRRFNIKIKETIYFSINRLTEDGTETNEMKYKVNVYYRNELKGNKVYINLTSGEIEKVYILKEFTLKPVFKKMEKEQENAIVDRVNKLLFDCSDKSNS